MAGPIGAAKLRFPELFSFSKKQQYLSQPVVEPGIIDIHELSIVHMFRFFEVHFLHFELSLFY
jgi:hypothetical protein